MKTPYLKFGEKSPFCKIFAAVIFLCLPFGGMSQKISGIVRDKKTGDPIPFVNIWIEGTLTGTTTDIKGSYSLLVSPGNLVSYSAVGYLAFKKKIQEVDDNIPGNIELKPEIFELDEIAVKPNLSYDRYLFKKIIENKEANNPDNLNLSYDKLQRNSVLNTGRKKGRLATILSESLDFAAEENDSAMSYVPIYQSEKISRNIAAEKGRKAQTKVLSSKTDGIFPGLNSQIESLILNKVAFDVNFYDNVVSILDRGFPSPISTKARLYYNIYLEDSTHTSGVKRYKFSFFPKNERAILFKGAFWVEDGSFALTEIKAKLSTKANINFIRNMNIKVDFQKTSANKWYYKKQTLLMKMSLRNISEAEGDSIRSSTKKGYLLINKSSYYEELLPGERVAGERDSVITHIIKGWDAFDQKIHDGILRVKKDPYVKAVDKTGSMFLTGYFNMNKIDIGPIFDLFSRNTIEGMRITLPFRTSKYLFENFTVGGYLGYGTKNKEWKYGVKAKYLLPFGRRNILSVKYTDDYYSLTADDYLQFIKENPFSKGDGSIVASLTSRKANSYVFPRKSWSLGFETQLRNDIGLYIQPYYNINNSTLHVPFRYKNKRYNSFRDYGVLLNFRFSFKQVCEELFFSRIYYGNQKPVINFSIKAGKTILPREMDCNNLFAQFHVSVKNRFNVGQPYIRVMANAGYIMGNVPYTLLNKPFGTQSFGYARYTYNLLDHAAFAHNLYANLHLSFNGCGIILNQMPLIRRLSLREVVSLKTYYGKLTNKKNVIFDIPQAYNNSMEYPYVELGAGISNIFKCIRVEYIRRLTNGQKANTYSTPNGIRMRFEVAF